jgi:hypothetical protein
MPANVGIIISVNDQGTLKLKSFEKQVVNTVDSIRKSGSGGGIFTGFSKDSKSITDPIKNITKLKSSILSTQDSLKNLGNSDPLVKAKAGIVDFTKHLGLSAKSTAMLQGVLSKLGATGLSLGGIFSKVLNSFFGKMGGIGRTASNLFGGVSEGFLGQAKGMMGGMNGVAAAGKGASSSIGGMAKAISGLAGGGKAISGLTGAAGGAEGAVAGLAGAAGGAEGAIAGLAGGIGSLGAAAIPVIGAIVALTVAAISFGKAALAVGAQNEMFTVQYKTLYGSVEEAKKKFAEVREVTASTPFQLDEMITLNAQLKTVSGGLLDGKKGLTLIADAAAATNAPLEEVGRNVGRLFSAIRNGVPAGEALMRLTELGIISGDTKVKIQQMTEANKSSAEILAFATKELEKYKGGAERMSRTLQGVTSNIADMNREIMSQTGDELVQPMTSIKRIWLDFITAVKDTKAFVLVGIAMAAVMNIVATLFAVIMEPIKIIIKVITLIWTNFGKLASGLNGTSGGLGKIVKLFGSFYKSVISFRVVLFEIKAWFFVIEKVLTFVVNLFFKGYSALFKWIGALAPVKIFFNWLDGVLSKIAKVLEKVANFIDRFGEKIGAGTLFGTNEAMPNTFTGTDISGVLDQTKVFIKGLQELTEKEKVIAEFAEKRKEALTDIQSTMEKLKPNEIGARGTLEIEKTVRLKALADAEQKALDKIAKDEIDKANATRKESADKLKGQIKSAQDIYDAMLPPKTALEEIYKKRDEQINVITELNKESSTAVTSVFGSFGNALKMIKKNTADETRKLTYANLAGAMARAKELGAAQKAYFDNIADKLKTSGETVQSALISPDLSTGLRRRLAEIQSGAKEQKGGIDERKKSAISALAEEKSYLARKAAGTESAYNKMSVADRTQLGESELAKKYGVGSEAILKRISDNATNEAILLQKKTDTAIKEEKAQSRMGAVLTAMGALQQGMTTFRDLAAGNMEQGLAGLGSLGGQAANLLGATGPWGEVLSTGLGLIGSIFDSSKRKEEQESQRALREIERNTAKSNAYLASVDKNMSKLAHKMEELFILPSSSYYGAQYGLIGQLDRELAMSSQG